MLSLLLLFVRKSLFLPFSLLSFIQNQGRAFFLYELKTKQRKNMPQEEEGGESRIFLLEKELDAALERNHSLEKENEQLKQEVARLKSQLSALKTQNIDRKSALWKKVQTSINTSNVLEQKPTFVQSNFQEEQPPVEENSCPRLDSIEISAGKNRAPRVPKPPPKPSLVSRTLPHAANGKATPPPPPPPPLPSKSKGGYSPSVRRVPEVLELYRSLTRRDPKAESKAGAAGNPASAANTRNMIGEIENRSAYQLAIKSDVETQGDFIALLTREVENAAYTEISDVEAFVKWLDEELSHLVDERAVLKHFRQWPERKADAIREAAFCYRDLKNLEMEVSSCHGNSDQPTLHVLKRMQVFQDKLERGVHNLERMRENASKRYKEFQIPWEWMLESGIISQLKHCSMKIARDYMKRIAKELKSSSRGKENEDLILQGVRFAFRVHQFAGGFNAESMQAFQELRKAAMLDTQLQKHAFSAQPTLL